MRLLDLPGMNELGNRVRSLLKAARETNTSWNNVMRKAWKWSMWVGLPFLSMNLIALFILFTPTFPSPHFKVV